MVQQTVGSKKSEKVPRSLLAVRVAAVVVITNTAKVVIVGGGGGPHLEIKIFSSKFPRIKSVPLHEILNTTWFLLNKIQKIGKFGHKLMSSA